MTKTEIQLLIEANYRPGPLEGIRDTLKGERAFVLGNGPSLDVTDLTKLDDEITFGCNRITDRIEPTYYVLHDRTFIRENSDHINAYPDWKFVTCYANLWGDINDHRVIWFRPEVGDYIPRSLRWPVSIAHYVYRWNTSVTTMIQLAYHLGVRELYLVGVDEDYGPEGDGESNLEARAWGYQSCGKHFWDTGGQIFNATKGGALEIFARVDYDSLFGWK